MLKQFVQVFKCRTGLWWRRCRTLFETRITFITVTEITIPCLSLIRVQNNIWIIKPLIFVKYWFDSLLWISESRTVLIWLIFINLTVFFVYSIHHENNESLWNPWQNRIDEFNINARHDQRTNNESATLNNQILKWRGRISFRLESYHGIFSRRPRAGFANVLLPASFQCLFAFYKKTTVKITATVKQL